MSNLLLLLKVDLIRSLSLNKLKNNKNIFKLIGMAILALFIVASLLTSVGSYTYMGLKFLMKYGLESYLLPMIYFLCSFIIFYTNIYRAKSYLFNTDDTIFAMPIKPSTILTTRIIVLMVLNYIPTIVICLPSFIVYGVLLKLSAIYYVYAFISLLFIPFVPTILGCIFGYLIGYLTSKVSSKKIFETIITYATVLLIMYASFNIQNLALKFVNNIEVVNKFLSNIGFLINSFMNIVSKYSLKDLSIFILANIATVLIFVVIFKNSYIKIIQNLKVEKTKNKYIEKQHVAKGTLATLFLKELRMYFSIPIYILNTSFGVILILFASIATLFYDKNMILKMMEIDAASMSMYIAVLILIGFLVGTSNTAACSISIEGKNFWILKTMPIKTTQILLSKILLNIFIVLPLTIVSIIIFSFSFKLTILQTIIVIVLAATLNLACSMFGILVNLKYPRLDFVSYTHVVKQSFSSFLGVMVPLALLFGFGALYTVLNISIDMYVLLVFALLLAIIMIQYMILKKWGIKRFYKIN